jgi:hypothetical protein
MEYGDENSLFHWHANSLLNGCGSPDFNRFVRNVIDKCPGYVSQLYGRYTYPKVDFIGKQENLRDDLIAVLRMRGLPFDEDYIKNAKEFGVSLKSKTSIDWDLDLKNEVCYLELPAIRAYGYNGWSDCHIALWNLLELASHTSEAPAYPWTDHYDKIWVREVVSTFRDRFSQELTTSNSSFFTRP